MPGEPAIVDPEAQVAPEILAASIVRVADAAGKILAGPLKERAIILLIQDACPGKISYETIRSVLTAAAGLKRRYVKETS